MPLFFLLVGLLLVVAGINGKTDDLGALVKSDFSSQGGVPGFGVWIVALFVAGSLGYIRPLRPVANSFIVLILIAILLSNKGFFSKFSSAVKGI